MQIVALAGGVGGAKLADGLAQVLPPDQLTIIVNIGDDFRHYGLHISPDLDTVMYTLSGYANPETGWGIRGESWQMLEMLQQYGESPWFRLGDRDLATHILRTQWLGEGHSMTEITHRLSKALGVQHTLLPATDDHFATMLDTDQGTLAFQDYFVRHRWQPQVQKIWYDGKERAQSSQQVQEALQHAEAIIICPSNPLLSIDPILSVGNIRDRLAARRVPCIAVSPLIRGRAIKGPADKLMQELGFDPSSDGLMHFYQNLIDWLVVSEGDEPKQGRSITTPILMKTPEDRRRLAEHLLDYLRSL